METTSKKNAERTGVEFDREELKSVMDNASIGTMTGALIVTCGTGGVVFRAKGEKATLVKAVTFVAKREIPFRAILINALENILVELGKEGGEA